jgi:hypothetical protein
LADKNMSDLEPLKRPRYTTGQLLTAADFTLEQNYFRDKLKRHNRTLHGFGIISGLRVSTVSGRIVVEPGLAVDCEGNEVVVGDRQTILATSDHGVVYVNLRYLEVCEDTIPITSDPGGDLAITQTSRIRESFALTVAPENCHRGHRHVRARWLPCGQPHELTIAKLRQGAHGWRVDRGYRPPAVK